MPESLPEFFLRVTGNTHKILPYQLRYGGDPFQPTLLVVPTGLGKTDAAMLPWLHAHFEQREGTPTRLIIVLPRQNLTGQTAANVHQRVKAAGLDSTIRVIELMGGSSDNRETLRPDEVAIIVCTQDMYFSRALNRGYARRPERWPIDFALFNNDAQIVFDELQLMSDALATSTQLAAMRQRHGVFGAVTCLWMSATVALHWLATVDFRDHLPNLRRIELNEDDRRESVVQQRLGAIKRLHAAPADCSSPEGCAAFALQQHIPGERTLIIVNTVDRAREICQAIQKHKAPAALVLIHSRFRPAERKAHAKDLESIPAQGQIVIATQVLEAGVDMSSHRLITDLAPWGSLVQRFGRTNRYGELTDGADVWWVERPVRGKIKSDDDPAKLYAPYLPAQIAHAAQRLKTLTSAAPSGLPPEDGPAPWQYVLRDTDLRDLFDTSPDLAGNNIDVSRFIRSGEERDCYIAWRNWEGAEPPTIELEDRELCAAPIDDKLRDFVRKNCPFTWSFADGRWTRVDPDKLYPGITLLAHAASGGYTLDEGWLPTSKLPVPVVDMEVTDNEPESDGSDQLSFRRKRRQTLREHTDEVVSEMELLVSRLERLDLEQFRTELIRAARLHDWGKAHDIMQETLRDGEQTADLLAKSTGNRRHKIPNFRHELASALAMVLTGESDLASYITAAHHGRIRMSIRSMPGEADKERTRGLRNGDVLNAGEIAAGITVQPFELSLDVMKLGMAQDNRRSWTGCVLDLLDRHGPFRLAYLETLLRAADERASARTEQEESAACAK